MVIVGRAVFVVAYLLSGDPSGSLSFPAVCRGVFTEDTVYMASGWNWSAHEGIRAQGKCDYHITDTYSCETHHLSGYSYKDG